MQIVYYVNDRFRFMTTSHDSITDVANDVAADAGLEAEDICITFDAKSPGKLRLVIITEREAIPFAPVPDQTTGIAPELRRE